MTQTELKTLLAAVAPQMPPTPPAVRDIMQLLTRINETVNRVYGNERIIYVGPRTIH